VTDLDKLKALLDGWGVPHKYFAHEDADAHVIKVGGYEHQRSATVGGYNGMYTLYYFNVDGKFLYMGAWE
jgi:hypothetical protein